MFTTFYFKDMAWPCIDQTDYTLGPEGSAQNVIDI